MKVIFEIKMKHTPFAIAEAETIQNSGHEHKFLFCQRHAQCNILSYLEFLHTPLLAVSDLVALH